MKMSYHERQELRKLRRRVDRFEVVLGCLMAIVLTLLIAVCTYMYHAG
jgi:hypothetical protein